MLAKMFDRYRMSREVKTAFSIARNGVSGFEDEAEVAGAIVSKSMDNMEYGHSAYCKEAYVKSAKYRVYLRAAYPNAQNSSIEQAALDVAWVDSRAVHPGMHEQNVKNAKRSLERVITENENSGALFFARR